MTIRLVNGGRHFAGLSLDNKPHANTSPQDKFGAPVEGDTFLETDTGRRYVYRNEQWQLLGQIEGSGIIAYLQSIVDDLRLCRRALEHLIGGNLEEME